LGGDVVAVPGGKEREKKSRKKGRQMRGRRPWQSYEEERSPALKISAGHNEKNRNVERIGR